MDSNLHEDHIQNMVMQLGMPGVSAWGLYLLGLVLITGLYCIIALHFQAYVNVIAPLLKKRLGTELGLIWCVIGLVLVYNIVYNHFFAMLLKPGSPKDLRNIEQLRTAQKNRASRKSVQKALEDDKSTAFDGLSPDVKRLLRYR